MVVASSEGERQGAAANSDLPEILEGAGVDDASGGHGHDEDVEAKRGCGADGDSQGDNAAASLHGNGSIDNGGGGTAAASQRPGDTVAEPPPLLIRRGTNLAQPQSETQAHVSRPHVAEAEATLAPIPSPIPSQDLLLVAEGLVGEQELPTDDGAGIVSFSVTTSSVGASTAASDTALRVAPSLSSIGRAGTDKSTATVTSGKLTTCASTGGNSTISEDQSEETLHDVLRNAYLRSVLYPSGVLDAKVERAKKTISLGVVQHQRPMFALMRYTTTKAIILLAAIVSGALAVGRCWLYASDRQVVSSKLYRITAMELRGDHVADSLGAMGVDAHSHRRRGDSLRVGEGGDGHVISTQSRSQARRDDIQMSVPLNIGDFGILTSQQKSNTPRSIGNCAAWQGVLNRSSDDSHIYLEYPRAVNAHGWYFTTWEGDLAGDPVRFKVEYLKDDGSWVLFGGTRWTSPTIGWTILLSMRDVQIDFSKVFDTTTLRDHPTIVDYSCTTNCIIEYIVIRFLLCIGLLATLAFIASNHQLVAEVCLRSTFLLMAIAHFSVLAFTYSVDGDVHLPDAHGPDLAFTGQRVGVTASIVLESMALLLLTFGLGRPSMQLFMIASSIISFVGEILRSVIIEGGQYAEYQANPWQPLLLLTCGLLMVSSRAVKFFRVRRLVAGDMERFDQEWEKLLGENRDQFRELRRMSVQVEKLARRRKIVARQMIRDTYSNLTGQLQDPVEKLVRQQVAYNNAGPPISRAGSHDSVDLETRIVGGGGEGGESQGGQGHFRWIGTTARNSRDKLKTFRDSWGLGLTLTNREVHVKSLDQLYAQAGAINVYLMQKVREWAEECGGTTDTAELKSVSSSIEKLLRSYKADVSRLLDVSRQRIVFDSVAKLIKCFERIAVDDSVLIVRCKNRLCAKYNSMYSAGYRDVCLNVRFVQGEPVRLGLDCHIVEIQLCLLPIFKLSTMETHKRYVLFRSHRGHAMVYFEQNFNRFISVFKLSAYRRSWGGKQSTDNRIAPSADSPSRHGATPVGHSGPDSALSPLGGHTGSAPGRYLTSTSNANANLEGDEESIHHAHGNRGRRGSSNHGLNKVALAASNLFSRLTSTGNFVAPATSSFDRQHRKSISKMELLYVPGRFTDPEYDVLLSSMFDNSQAADTFFNLPGIGQGSAHVIRKASSLLHQVDDADYNEAFYRSWFEMLTAFPGNFLDHRLRVVANGLGDASGNSALFTSRPLAAALRFVRWRFAVGFAAAAYMCVGFMSLAAQINFSTRPLPRLVSGEQGGIYSRFRFTAVDTRSGTPATFPGIDSFQVLQGGCPPRSEVLNISINGSKMEIVYHKPLAYDGFSIVTSTSHTPVHDPVRFILEGAVNGDGAHDDEQGEGVGSEHDMHGHRREEMQEMEGMGEASTKWEWVGSSSMAWGRAISMDKDSSLVDPMNNIPSERGVEFAILLTVPIWVTHCYIATSFVTGIGFMIIVVLATLNRVVEAAQAVYSTILAAGICNLCTAILLYHDQYVALGTYWIVFASIALSYGLVIAINERLFVPGLTSVGVLLTLLDFIFRLVQFPPDVAWQLFTSDPPATGLLAFFAGLTAFMLRWRTVSKARLMITSDCAAYEQEWQRVISNEMEDVGRLKGLTSVYNSCPLHLARQYCRKREFPLSADYKMFASKEADRDSATNLSDDEHDPAASFGVMTPKHGATLDNGSTSQWVSPESTFVASQSRRPKLRKSMRSFGTGGSQMRLEFKREVNAAIDPSTKVQSLDQLYAQAAGLHPVLQEKVQQWALESRGCFRVKQEEAVQISQPGTWVPTAATPSSTRETATFVRWEDAVRDSTLRGLIKWGKIKGIPRSIEKLLRSYDADPSKLLDVCRQTIVYDSVKDLCDGLKAIRDDPEVVVVRCKNRLDPNCNSAYNAGYRDVSLNIRIQNNASARIGVDCHVCEVQLMLRSFASIKNAEGHARYISFRNARGE